jgi:hypothetical protein
MYVRYINVTWYVGLLVAGVGVRALLSSPDTKYRLRDDTVVPFAPTYLVGTLSCRDRHGCCRQGRIYMHLHGNGFAKFLH